MSMLCYLLEISPAQVKALRGQPSLAADVAMAVITEGNVAQLGALQEPLDLQKSWHMLHYLFTGSVEDTNSPGAALLSGEELGEDISYGPVRLHDEKATAEFTRFLQGVDIETLLARMSITEMAEAGVYSVGDDAAVREEVGYYFPQLRDYVARVARKNAGLLTWLS